MGLYADPRRAEERRSPCGPLDHSADPEGGLPPVPQRRTSWTTSLKAHWGVIAGADFFTTEVWTWRGLVNAERFVRSIREECLDRMIPMGERHFRHALTEFVEHYHCERNHQGLDNRLIAGTSTIDVTNRVRCRRRLGGLLNFYERAA